MATGQRTFTADFYCLNHKGKRDSTVFKDLLAAHVGGHAPAFELEQGAKEKYQIRSISATTNGNVYMAVFGRLRHGGTPEQGTDDGTQSMSS